MGATQQTKMIVKQDQVNALIKQGQKRGLTGKDVIDALIRKGYEPEGVDVGAIKQKMQPVKTVEEKAPSLTEEVGEDINKRVEKVGDILDRQDSSTLEKGVQVFGQGAGLAANTLEKTAERIPGVKQVFEGIGKGIQWLSETAPIKAIGEKIGNTQTMQELTTLYDTDQNFKDSVDAVANIARLGGDVDAAMGLVKFTENVTNKVMNKVKTMTPEGTPPPPGESTPLLSPEGQALVDKVTPQSPDIMNRVARLNPKEFETFKKISGKTPGEYLTETGNFKAPDGIIQTEGKKFIETIAKKDAELAKLPGTFKDGSLSDALEGLLERAKATSGTKTKSPFLNQVLEWQSKLEDVGLTMDEINKLKRLYEREVKLGYNKLTNADKVQQATNIDSALRKFQDKTAKDLGFTNLDEINKQIQISKYLADKLGDKIVGQSGLNGVSITDWIILAGGDPTAVASFLTKKFFSSKGVQAKIAELLNKEGVKGLVSPEVTTTPMSIERTISPTGAKQLPAGGSSTIENRVPIELRGKFEMEKGVPKTSTKSTQSISKRKSRKASPNSTTKSLKVKGTIPENSLISEARKYKSAEEFVKAQTKLFHGGTADLQEIKLGKSNFQKTFYMSDNADYAKSYGGSKSSLNEISLDKNANLADMRKPSTDLVNQIQNIIESKPTGKMVKLTRPDGSILEIPEVKGGLKNQIYSTKKIIQGIKDGDAMFAELPEVKQALKKLGYDGQITTESKFGSNYGVWNKEVIKTKSQLTDIYNKANKK